MRMMEGAKNFSFVSLGRIITVILLALFYLFFASILDPEKYGELSVILALAGTFATISRFGLQNTAQIYIAKNKSDLSDKVGTLFLILTSAAALILIPIDIYAAVLSLAISFFVMNQKNLLGLRQYKNFMLNSLLKNSVGIILSIILYFIFEEN